MQNMVLCYDIFSDAIDAAYSGGSWSTPLSSLADPRPDVPAVSNGLSTDNTKFRIDLGQTRRIWPLAVYKTNLSATGQAKVTWYSDSFTTTIASSGWFTPAGYPTEDPDGRGVSIWYFLPAPADVRALQWEFSDASNGDGFVSIGRNLVPNYWQPPRNFDVNAVEDEVPNTPRTDALSGTGYFIRRTPARLFQFGFSFLPAAEAPTIRRIRKISNLNKQVAIIPDPEDVDNFNDRNFIGTLRQMPKIGLLQAGLAAGNGFEIFEAV